MDQQETNLIICGGVVVPESALLSQEKRNPYGNVEGLPDEEFRKAVLAAALVS